ncbi:hypothetical protein C8R41DRAFT_871980 [Lentinula lateritia]|uniref:Uncharacterized protein n=1 Tax=Lentinula lateritia TaxID=40482 RepID=A0ABQ8UXK3_9AGAR|nr:hypothetical protein C8R41DRAFT_871980 [Lentinula lateritia]
MFPEHTSKNQSIPQDSDMGTGKDVSVTGMYQDTNMNNNAVADKVKRKSTHPDCPLKVRRIILQQPDETLYTLSKADSRFSSASLSANPVPVSATSGSNKGSMPIAASDWSNVPRCYPRKQCPIPGYDFSSYDCDRDTDSEHSRNSPSPTPTEIIEFDLSPEEIRQDLKERGIIVRDFGSAPVRGTRLRS